MVLLATAVLILAAGVGVLLGFSALNGSPSPSRSIDPSAGQTAAGTGSAEASLPEGARGESRGYLTTPGELVDLAERARAGDDALAEAVESLVETAELEWDYQIDERATCPSPNEPEWLDDSEGASRLNARALAYHITGDERYASEVRDILERIMSTVVTIDLDEQRCRLVFGWGTPELVASADLIEGWWQGQTCTGPTSARHDDEGRGEGDCKELFQNWLVKNPYYLVSYTGIDGMSNWGAAGTTAMAYVADYLWDRPDVTLVHRQPLGRDDDEWDDVELSPGEAYAFANQLALDRMNGYGVDLHSNESCDYLRGDQQHPDWPPVKSQITETGIITEDARRDEFCNVPEYDGTYQNYPQIHLGNLIQQCELELRRGDRSCYDNVDKSDLPNYTFVGPDGENHETHLRPGRGSVERAINAVIVDSATEWTRPSALAVAYRYYRDHHALGGVDQWTRHLQVGASAAQDLSFGNLTHALADGDAAPPPPVVAPPSDR